MKKLMFVMLVACGSGQHAPANNTTTTTSEPTGVVKDSRSPLEKRRDAACDQLAPKLTECAVEDAKKTMTPEEYKKLNPDELRDKHREKFLKECKGSQMSSRQVRVLEVCFKQETECDPLAQCLTNLAPQKN